jgi:hypothetical protein
MSGAPNNFSRPNDLPGVGEWAIVLADVDAVGINGGGEFGEIVENEGDFRFAAKWEKATGDTLDGGEIVIFGAKLENVCTALNEGAGDRFRVFLGDIAEVEDAVEECRMRSA